jgi:DNA-binding beta-propeller fold protein YncE
MPFDYVARSASKRRGDALARHGKRERFARESFFRRPRFEALEDRRVLSTLGTSALVESSMAGSDTDLLVATGAWTATPNSSWLHLAGANTGATGNATILFTFDANPGATARTGTLTIAGGTLSVTQAGTSYVAANPVVALVSTGINFPTSVAVDGLGNVYYADANHNAIREWIAPTNTVSTLVSTGLNTPNGLAVDSSGDVYIADTVNKAIKEWNAQSHVLTPLVVTGLTSPQGVTVDDTGNVYFSDTFANTLKEWIAGSSTVTTLISTGLSGPYGLAVDVAGNVYIADSSNNAIKEWVAASKTVSTLVSVGLSSPVGVAVDGSGNVYIADSSNNAIKERVVATGTVVSLVSKGLNRPEDVAVDANGNVYIADSSNFAVKEMARAYVGPTGQTDPLAGGSDSLLPVLPTTENLSAPFAPSSSQGFLTFGAVTGGVVNYNLTAAGATRTANITLLGQTIVITQQTLFQQSGTTLTVGSNPSDENLQVNFTSATTFNVTLGATTNSYTTAGVNQVVFAGADASATAAVTDTFNNLTSAILTPATMTIKAANYEIDVTNTTTNTVSGGAADTATLSDATKDSRFYGHPGVSQFLNTDIYNGPTFTETVDDFGTVNATSFNIGDVASLYDSQGTNTFTASPTTANMTGPGYAYNVTAFHQVDAIGTAANNDTAYFADSTGGSFNSSPTVAISDGTGYFNQASNFKVVYDIAANANDQASLYDRSGANVFEHHNASGGNPAYSVFYSRTGSFYDLVYNSLQVTATSASTMDQAYIGDNTAGSRLYAHPTNTLLANTGFNFLANNFGNVQTTETGTSSTEVAYMYDSTGVDRFYGTPTQGSVVAGTGYSSVAIGFGQSYGISAGGGNDFAYLYDAAGNGTFYGGNTQSTMQGTGYYYTAVGFRYTFGIGAGGGDMAAITDTVGGNFFEGHQAYSVLYNSTNLYVLASNFTTVNATGNGNKGTDTAFFYDAPANDYVLAFGDNAQLGYQLVNSSPATVVNVAAFANVAASSTLGGVDKKYLQAVDFNLSVTGNWT